MIFLERLVARRIGAIDDVEIAFAPRGLHLIEASPEAAIDAKVRSSLRAVWRRGAGIRRP